MEKPGAFGLIPRPSTLFAGYRELEFLGHSIGSSCMSSLEASKVQKQESGCCSSHDYASCSIILRPLQLLPEVCRELCFGKPKRHLIL